MQNPLFLIGRDLQCESDSSGTCDNTLTKQIIIADVPSANFSPQQDVQTH